MRTLLAVTLTALLLAPELGQAADEAPPPSIPLDLPAQPLDATLGAIARAASLDLVWDPALTAGKSAPAVSGVMTAEEALRSALAGSGLEARFTAPAKASLAKAPPPPPPPPPRAAAPAPPRAELEEVSVTGERQGSYGVRGASVATRTDTSIDETPASVQVVPAQVLADQGVAQLDEALANVSGVLASAEQRGGLQETVWLRGFETTGIFRDGVLAANPNGSFGLMPMTNVERVEVLKGPAAVLYGRMEPGGLVNVVTKRPEETARRSVSQTAGSYELTSTVVDATGPLDEGRSLLYRAVASYDQGGTPRRDLPLRRTFLAPSLAWRPHPSTALTLAVEYTDDSAGFLNTNSIYDPATGQVIWLPRTNNLAPFDNRARSIQVAATWAQRLGEAWALKARYTHVGGRASGAGFQFGGFSQDPGTGAWLLSRFFLETGDRSTNDAAALELTGRLSTGPLAHALLLGADLQRVGDRIRQDVNFAVPATDAFNPSAPSGLGVSGEDWILTGLTDQTWGVFLQDQVKGPWGLHAVAGVRYQAARVGGWSEFSPSLGGGGRVDDEVRRDGRLIPRGGLLWQASGGLGIYGSYSEGFGANNGWDFEHKRLPNESARQYEVGAKTSWLGGAASATVSLFHLTKTDMAVADPLHTGFNITVGEIRSRGVEADLQGELAPGWNLLASYAFDDVVITKGSPGGGFYVEGNRMPNVPRHLGRLATTYGWRAGALRGLKLGAGVRFVGRTLDNTNADVTPGYVLYDAMAAWEFRVAGQRAWLQANAKNLADKFYYTSSFVAPSASTIVLHDGRRRALSATVGLEF